MATFVLVHGAWHGSWCWARVARQLRALGHDVYAPTLSGLADRRHLANCSINLSTHIEDITALLRWEGLTKVILVGHSYGGFVISSAAAHCGSLVDTLVYLDAFVPDPGQCLLDMIPEVHRGAFLKSARDGRLVDPIKAKDFDVNPEDQAWVDAQCTAHPVACFLEPAVISAEERDVRRRVYVQALAYAASTFGPISARLRQDPSWSVATINAGHDVMLDNPDETTRLLLECI